MKISLNQQIDEINRELGERKHVYPRLVSGGKLRESVAAYQVARLEAARTTLQWLAENETEIREIMAERRRLHSSPADVAGAADAMMIGDAGPVDAPDDPAIDFDAAARQPPARDE